MMSLAQAGKAKDGCLSHEPKDLAPEGLDRGYEDSTLFFRPGEGIGMKFQNYTPFSVRSHKNRKGVFFMNKKVTMIAAAALAALLLLALLAMHAFAPETHAGSKSVVFVLVDGDGNSEEFILNTDSQYLADALVEAGLVEYAKDGMYVTINGITADWNADGAWWNILKDGEALMVGMNEQPIADGEHYEAVYTVG